MSLPTTYNRDIYRRFIEAYGTHFFDKVGYGCKWNYTLAFDRVLLPASSSFFARRILSLMIYPFIYMLTYRTYLRRTRLTGPGARLALVSPWSKVSSASVLVWTLASSRTILRSTVCLPRRATLRRTFLVVTKCFTPRASTFGAPLCSHAWELRDYSPLLLGILPALRIVPSCTKSQRWSRLQSSSATLCASRTWSPHSRTTPRILEYVPQCSPCIWLFVTLSCFIINILSFLIFSSHCTFSESILEF